MTNQDRERLDKISDKWNAIGCSQQIEDEDIDFLITALQEENKRLKETPKLDPSPKIIDYARITTDGEPDVGIFGADVEVIGFMIDLDCFMDEDQKEYKELIRGALEQAFSKIFGEHPLVRLKGDTEND